MPGKADDIDVVVQRPRAGPCGQPDVTSEDDPGDRPLRYGHLGDAGLAVHDEAALRQVDARTVPPHVDDAIGIGAAFDVVMRVGSGAPPVEARTKVAESVVESGHGCFLLAECETTLVEYCGQAGARLSDPRGGLPAHDDVVGETHVPVPRVAHRIVHVGEGEVGNEGREAGALGDSARANPPAPG